MDRRRFLLAGLALASAPVWAEGMPSGALETASMETLAGKKPLIKRSFRPPNYETPLNYFQQEITPNDAFFVRWHLSGIPRVKAEKWKLKIGGACAKPQEFTLEQLRQDFNLYEVTAVCQCSGNRRGLSAPHVPGVQWGYGAMGNARWKGVRLADLLQKAQVKDGVVEVAFAGADRPVHKATPDFAKSLPLSRALDENVLVAFEMNGEALPHWNGFPARLVVPGWTATYWIKQLDSIEFLTAPLANFWMDPAYRIPAGLFPVNQDFPTQEKDGKTPITEIMVNSLITAPESGANLRSGKLVVRGLAWDGGYGIETVEISDDLGRSWKRATLEKNQGPYSFQPFNLRLSTHAGKLHLMARATNKIGQTQVTKALWNAAGYHHNVVHEVEVRIQ
ncbi:MAG: molybdopterin-dependent oxidoreductase [Vulcanimicrobiota bacterium]